MISELDGTLLGLIATMIAAGVLVMKWLMVRSDKAMKRLETQEDDVHEKIIEGLGGIVRALAAIASTQEAIVETQQEIISLLRENNKAKSEAN